MNGDGRGDIRLDREYRFGEYQFYPARGVLLRKGSAVKIGSRAIALLAALVQRPGEILGYDDLMRYGWAGTHVDAANLRVQMSALRRLLDNGEDAASCITNAPGRGYSLTVLAVDAPASKAASSGKPPVGLVSPMTTIVGRGEDVDAVLQKIARSRCVTIVGPGGIGKTRVAIEACWCITDDDRRRIVFVDLAPVASEDHVAAIIAATLELQDGDQGPPVARIEKALKSEPTLLVLDNCEHVLEATAALVELLLRHNKTLSVMATSREPLLIEGEATVRLTGLGLPEHDADVPDLLTALSFPAIELLAERAGSSGSATVGDGDVNGLIEICRRLDGIPLAIELAAAQIEAIGVGQLADLLASQFSILGESRRSALPRHRTMEATLEWSFEMLKADERDLLVALSVFRGEFQMEAAVAIAPMEPEVILKRLAGLVTKSLVMVSRTGSAIMYRLLETTRAFCLPKLAQRPDAPDIHHKHAQYLVSYLQRAIKLDGTSAMGKSQRNGELRAAVADVRAAIEWGLHKGGDSRLAVRLIVESGPMWLRLSMLKDYAYTIEDAIDILAGDPNFDDKDLVWLAPSMHKSWYNCLGLSEKVQPMLIRAIEVARRIGDNSCLLDCQWAMFGTRLTQARYGEALAYARGFQEVAEASEDKAQQAMAHRIVALSMWRDGQLREATSHGRAALQSNAHLTAHVQLDLMYKQGVTSRANMSNLLWLTGRADAALDMAHEAVTIGLSGDVLGLSYGLAQTIIPLTFWVGDVQQAESLSALLVKISIDNDYGYWVKWGKAYQSAVARLRSGTTSPEDTIEETKGKMDGLQRHILATILPDLSLDWVTELDHVERRAQPHWCTAELQRVAALRLMREGDVEGARAQLEFAVDTASRQGALAWELRAVMNLAELDAGNGDPAIARGRLSQVLERITEGAKTVDVKRARKLYASLA